jgi:hypothetical protein
MNCPFLSNEFVKAKEGAMQQEDPGLAIFRSDRFFSFIDEGMIILPWRIASAIVQTPLIFK